jgi:hypothetical protein
MHAMRTWGGRILAGLALAAPIGGPSWAQQSAGYRLTEWVLNAGGDPRDAAVLVSASYRITLDAIGEPVSAAGLTSAGYQSDAGFVAAYRPPGEASGLRFATAAGLEWNVEPSAGGYHLYRDGLATLPGAFGTCAQASIPAPAATDAAAPAAGAGFFYLVTAVNRLGEEGTKGFRSSGAERPNPAPCP